jgi:inner membrane protein
LFLEPFTHAFTSLALSQTARHRLPRWGTLMMVAGGVAPDIDAIGWFFGPSAFFHLHRAVFHSLLGGFALACAVAYIFVDADKKIPFTHPQKKKPAPITFPVALLFCGIGVMSHILIDLLCTVGVDLFWPFYNRFYGVNLVVSIDLWMLALLIFGLLFPLLIRLVNEEIGTKKSKKKGPSVAAIATLVLVVAYLGARYELRAKALHLLLYRDYFGREADSAHAYPTFTSPFLWRGVITTDDTMEVINVPVLNGDEFENSRSLSFYKPQPTPDLKAAQATVSAKRFMLYAGDPYAKLENREDDLRVELHDLRFAQDDTSPENIVMRVQFNSFLKERYEKFIYATVFVP